MSPERNPNDTAFWEHVDACLDARVDVWTDDAVSDGLLEDPTRIAALEVLAARLAAVAVSAPAPRHRWRRAAALVAVGVVAAALAMTLKPARQERTPAAPPPPVTPATPPRTGPAVTVLSWHITSTRTSPTSTSSADVSEDGTTSTTNTDTDTLNSAGLTARITHTRHGVAKP